jgi:2-methylcitrate dehydratase PrpD
LFDQIDGKYMLETIMFKPYNCCYLIHPAIQAFMDICSQNNLTAKDIRAVTVGLSAFSVSHAGKIIIPHDELGAQFSTSFTLALSLLKETPGMWSYTNETLTDESILALASKISVYVDGQATTEFPQKNGCVVNVTTGKGLVLTQRLRDPKGSPADLMTEEDVKTKFMKNTIPIIGESDARTFHDVLSRFHEIENIRQFSIIERYKSPAMACY